MRFRLIATMNFNFPDCFYLILRVGDGVGWRSSSMISGRRGAHFRNIDDFFISHPIGINKQTFHVDLFSTK